MLTTDNQKKIVTEINSKLLERKALCTLKPMSSTFTPYFDVTLTDEQKSKLIEVPMSSMI